MSKRKSSSAEGGDLEIADKDLVAVPDAGYTVLARRYRPGQFGDLVGQESVARALSNALESGRVAHAYLFTGARGVGKTSTARILAKALNCQKGTSSHPCGECENCKAIAAGEDVDVLEIDGASNRGIDEIREIRQNVQYKPTRSRFKIYIVDEVHMLTGQAFNALLKTLEEPPAHVKFIFATTEVQKIPITILSRCQRFDFLGISTNRIIERLREMARTEGQTVEDAALEQIARRAGGSMRDAQSLLDQLLAFGSGNLTGEHVYQLLGTAQDDRVVEVASAILSQDTKRALELVGGALDEGAQTGEFVDQLIQYWRDLMLVKYTGADNSTLTTPTRLRPTLIEQAKSVSIDSILAGLDILAAVKFKMRTSGHPRMLIEATVVRLGRLGDLVSIVQLTQHLASGAPAVTARPATSTAQAPSAQPKALERNDIKKKILDNPPAEIVEPPTPQPTSAVEIFNGILELAPPILASYLKQASPPAIIGPKTLAVIFGADYNGAKDYCQSPSSQARLEEFIKRVAGPGWTIRIDSTAREAGGNGPAQARSEDRVPNYKVQRAEAIKHPLVHAAMEKLDATMVEVDDGFGSQASPGSGEVGANGTPPNNEE
jgi:DNA polymerase-3 subunit gamma/tau